MKNHLAEPANCIDANGVQWCCGFAIFVQLTAEVKELASYFISIVSNFNVQVLLW